MSESLSPIFAALADPTRRAMLERLAAGEATVKELAAPFGISQPAVSKHLKVLEAAGLVSWSKTAQTRPRRINAVGLKHARDWIDQFRDFWPDSFDRLDAYLNDGRAPR
ncbi:MAG: transcriptional regulator [Sphingobium sp. 66-54]|nr:MAG: transcriptional regulator [Sphingobium sp. 66-54]